MRRTLLGLALVAVGVSLAWWGWRGRPPAVPSAVPAEASSGASHPPPGVSASAVTPEAPRSAAPVEPPPLVQRVLENPSWRPTNKEELAALAPLSAEVEAQLVERYLALSGLSNKVGLVEVLAWGGSEAVVPVLARAITNEFAGQSLSEWEAEYFPVLLHLMGCLAQRHRSAFEFLRGACEPPFWDRHPLPQVSNVATLKASLVNYALIGLAFSGRTEALEYFEEIRRRPPEQWPGGAGSVVDAVFRYRMLQTYGEAYIRGKAFGDLYSMARAFSEWWRTEEGRSWANWAATHEGPVESPPPSVRYHYPAPTTR